VLLPREERHAVDPSRRMLDQEVLGLEPVKVKVLRHEGVSMGIW